MSSPTMTRLFTLVLGATLLLSSPVSGLTAWWTELSPHMALQDPGTGNIVYSACNSNSTPILPTDGRNVFRLGNKPRNGTSLAAAGWYDADKKTTIASIFYQNETGTIVNGYFECDFSSGHYSNRGEYSISDEADVLSIHNETGLSVVLLGSTAGYRVFFHDQDKKVNVMSYTVATKWQLLPGAISQDPAGGLALASSHSDQTNMVVAFPRDSQNFEFANFSSDQTWRIATLPRPLAGNVVDGKTNASDIRLDTSRAPNFTLPAYSSDLTGLGTLVDKTNVSSIFYLGTDAKLRQVSNIDGQWRLMDQYQWPAGEFGSRSFAMTSNSDTNEAWIWYRSNGSLIQLHRGSTGGWETMAVPSVNTTSSSGNGTPTAVPTDGETPVVLSTGAKAGIGIGISVGVVALAGVGVLLLKRRRQQQAAAAEAARVKEAEAMARAGNGGVGPHTGPGSTTWGSNSPIEKHGAEVLEADAVDTATPQELMNTGEVYELVGEGHWREMDATGQNRARRSIGGWREAHEEKVLQGEKK